ncbi:MAG TPA: signal peptidase I, partial [Marinilabiliaceae bacterium]|nr:signal peptidase I [Marinilabiliaceae bacterium]
WPKWNYKRLKGFSDVKRNDIVVFNFPTGDTVPFLHTNPDYYITIRELGLSQLSQNSSLIKDKQFTSEYEFRQFVNSLGRSIVKEHPESFGEVHFRPVDRRDNYVKRCVALPGDTFQIKSNQIFINGQAVQNPEGVQHNYHVITDGTLLNQRFFDRLEISNDDRNQGGVGPHYILPLTAEMAKQVASYKFVQSVEIDEQKPSTARESVYPFSEKYPWSRDNYGPLVMPKEGVTVALNMDNILLYERIITAYEGNDLKVKDNTIYINGEKAENYTFKMNYYFMMGDNRHKSADSRYWGFVPEDHIVGRPILVWLSLNKDKNFPANIRWNRFFKLVTGE